MIACVKCNCVIGGTDPLCSNCRIADAVSRLSPTVRELLLSNPEAVEKCVEAVKAASKYRAQNKSNHSVSGWLSEELDERYKAYDTMDAAIAAITKGEELDE